MPNSNDHEICCSFCGKPQSVADRLIAGSGVYICDACVRLCMSIIEDEDRLKTGRSDEKEVGILLPKPQEIKKKLDEALATLYEQTVPEAVREYLDSRSAPVRERPRRPSKSAGKARTDESKNGSVVFAETEEGR